MLAVHLRTPDELLIHARHLYEQVVADPRRHLEGARRLVEEARGAQAPEAVVHALRALAWAQRALLAPTDALRHLNQASAIARRNGLAQALAEVLVARAAVDQELGRFGAARRDLQQAGPYLEFSGRAVRAEHAKQLGTLHQNSGRLVQAEVIYRQLLDEPGTAPRVRAIVSNNLGLILSQQGRHRDAVRLLEEATLEAERIGPAVHALLIQTTAWATVKAGRLADGLKVFGLAADAYRAAELSLGEHYIEYVDAMMDLRLAQEATDAVQRAWVEFSHGGPELMAAETRLRMAQVALMVADVGRAVEAANDAAERFGRQGRPGWRARALLVAAEARASAGLSTPEDLRRLRRIARSLEGLGSRASGVRAHLTAGRAAIQVGRPDLARDSLATASRLSRSAPPLVRLHGRVAGALLGRLDGRDDEVLRQCRVGLTDLHRHRGGLDSMQLRATASGHGVELGRLGLQVALSRRSPAAVLSWMERTRSAALLATVDHSTAAIPRTGELRQLLGERVLAEFAVLEDDLVVVTLDRRGIRLLPLGPAQPVRTEADSMLFSLRRLVQPQRPAMAAATRSAAERALTRLRALLIEPLGVAPDSELVVVPSSRLSRVPWPSLHSGPVSTSPSAALWVRTLTRASSGDGVALAAGPGLAGAADEVRQLQAIYPGATVLAPPQSTVTAVITALKGAATAHLACHGRARLDNPMFSELLLSDGSLSVQHLESEGAAPDRVVLAACGSGLDAELPGDEMLGFVSALMSQGTAAVLASIASIPDLHTVSFMLALHRQLAAGSTMAHALHTARQSLDVADPASFTCSVAFAAHGAA